MRLPLCLALCLGCVEDANPALEDDADSAARGDAVAGDDAGPGSDVPSPGGPLPRIEIAPPALVFATDGAETLRIGNTGDAALEVGALALDGEARAFTLVRDGRNALAGAIGVIEPGGGVEIEVSYRASDRRDEADLIVTSDDPRRPMVRVPMTGGVGARCLEAEPRTLELGQIRVGAPVRRDVVLRNCGDAEVIVTAVGFADDAQTGFSVDAGGLPGTIGRGDERVVTVTVQLDRLGPATAELRVETDGEALRIQVLAIGADNACPHARVPQEVILAEVRDVVVLDGSASVDPDGDIVRFEWVFIERPVGSTSQPVESFHDLGDPFAGGVVDDVTSATALFAVDLRGRYVLELRVTDTEGCVGTAQLVVDASGRNGLRVELVWDTEADLDLHLLHPDGAWFVAPLDCYFGNAAPDWGRLEDPTDDPEVLSDDSDGFGPETIRLGRPQEDLASPYLVGVHAFGRAPFPAEATVRVYVDGLLVDEATRTLAAGDHFWEAFQVAWPDVELRDRYHQRRP